MDYQENSLRESADPPVPETTGWVLHEQDAFNFEGSSEHGETYAFAIDPALNCNATTAMNFTEYAQVPEGMEPPTSSHSMNSEDNIPSYSHTYSTHQSIYTNKDALLNEANISCYEDSRDRVDPQSDCEDKIITLPPISFDCPHCLNNSIYEGVRVDVSVPGLLYSGDNRVSYDESILPPVNVQCPNCLQIATFAGLHVDVFAPFLRNRSSCNHRNPNDELSQAYAPPTQRGYNELNSQSDGHHEINDEAALNDNLGRRRARTCRNAPGNSRRPSEDSEPKRPKIINTDTGLTNYLKAMVEVREMPVRSGRVLPALGLQPKLERDHSIIATTRGQVAHRKCDFCASGNGPYTECIVLPGPQGAFGGGCTNCKYSHQGNHCHPHYSKEVAKEQTQWRSSMAGKAAYAYAKSVVAIFRP